MSLELARAFIRIRADSSRLPADFAKAQKLANKSIKRINEVRFRTAARVSKEAAKPGGQRNLEKAGNRELRDQLTARRVAVKQAEKEALNLIKQRKIAVKDANRIALNLLKQRRVAVKQTEKEALNLIKQRTAATKQAEKEALNLLKQRRVAVQQAEKVQLALLKQRRVAVKQAEKARLALIKRRDVEEKRVEKARLAAIRKRKEELKGLVVVMAAQAAVVARVLVGFTKNTVLQAAQFEQLNVAFETMFGNAELARLKIEELQDFAAKTPFTLPGVESAARSLLAVGFSAEELLPTLKTLGDISAGLGRGEEGLRRLILNMGQVKAQAKLTGRELRDFAILGVPIIETLSDTLGVTAAEIQRLTQAGEISSKQVVEAFTKMTQEGGRFNDLMAKINKTALGLFSNLKDELTLTQRALGEGLIPVISELEESLISMTRVLRDNVEANRLASSGALIGATAFSALAAAALVAAAAIQFFNTSLKVVLITTLVGIALLALAALLGAIIAKFTGADKAAKEFKDQMNELKDVIKGVDGKILGVKNVIELTSRTMKSDMSPVLDKMITQFKLLRKAADDLGDSAAKNKRNIFALFPKEGPDFSVFLASTTVAKNSAAAFAELVVELQKIQKEVTAVDELTAVSNRLKQALFEIPGLAKAAGNEFIAFGKAGADAAKNIKKALGIIQDEKNNLSGITNAIKDAKDELSVLRGERTKIGLLGESFLEAGASAKKVSELTTTLKALERAKIGEAARKKGEQERQKIFADEAAKAKSDREKLESAAKSVFEGTRTLREQFGIKVAELKNLFGKGFIDADTFARAFIEERKKLEPKPLIESGRSGFREFGRKIQDAILGNDAEARDKKRNALLEKQLKANNQVVELLKIAPKPGLGP